MADLAERFAHVLELPEEERAGLAALLIRSLDNSKPDADRDSAWASEVSRRLTDLDEGRATLTPWEDVRTRLIGSLSKSRKA